jgi:acetyl-CoA carboxylase carboxyl transferase subunit beta
VEEPDGGADADPAGTAASLRAALRGALADLLPLDQMNLVTRRRARFRQFGVAQESQPDLTVEATR